MKILLNFRRAGWIGRGDVAERLASPALAQRCQLNDLYEFLADLRQSNRAHADARSGRYAGTQIASKHES